MTAKRITVAKGNCRISIKLRWPKGRSLSLETVPEGIPMTEPAYNATRLALRLHMSSPPRPKVSREKLMEKVQDAQVKKLLSHMSDDEYAAILERGES